jgi:hypothetical protein
MEQSILNFRRIHPDWMPGNIDDDDSSAYVNQVSDPLRSANAYRMGVTNQRRPSQPFLGFAAGSQMGQSERRDRNHAPVSPRDESLPFESQSMRRPFATLSPGGRSARAQLADSDLLREMEEGSEQKFESELGDSFMTPSQAVNESEEDEDKGHQGVLGLLNHLYQETGTGKGIGM